MSREIKGGCKDVRRLIRLLKPGLTAVPNGKAHVNIAREDGTLVRFDDGRPVDLPCSPHPSRFKAQEKRLRDMGLLQ